ncbi:ZIP zinc/iron transport family [Xylariaceae sp. FL0804]|nr:ZIP zinc/iron transport family [Xylariaceae sp. FL0804]
MPIVSQALDAMLVARQDDGSAHVVTVDCDSGNDFDGRIGLRISSIFVILVGALLGAVGPVLLARGSKMRVNGRAFFVAKYFGSGVIIATAFIHLLSPAEAALNNPCLPDGPFQEYDFAACIALMTVFVMFTIELLASRFDFFGHAHDTEGADPSLDILKKGSNASDAEHGGVVASKEDDHQNGFRAPGLPDDVSYPPGGQDHLAHQREHKDDNSHTAFAAQMTALFILEFGVVFHSIFIGLTLAVAGEEFTVLYIVLVFHQTFEGLGLGSRLATAQWPVSKRWMPYVLGVGYAFSTPIAIAIGLGVRTTLKPGSSQTTIINGIFDSISAGILIYTGLVELLAHEFMFNNHMRNAGLKVQLFALSCVGLGIGLMALLGKWA